ncbi:uncharacterized protein LOC106162301 [Lingula anatina]|uniref:Uncharacterized protein LOC106151540 n=1 Tax=Lingula anatina TaxID=7574 RepID=A0A1S3IAW9_LINAN|nr:uncharacterized protein LOC106151540 [Lingula anatina]XP_013380318.1 uncharacterized protein LOC106151540 [Lingula anatina]XP_013395001.1 uncharacterized protein LOC106162301 [Lingula anatina]|eukprot:XP_013380317.1 uncharacterized protein LOC106151540 [Lingula anatina]
MAKEQMHPEQFGALLHRIMMETGSSQKKLEILFSAKGYYNANQVSSMLNAFAIPSDKVRAMQIMEPRLCRMTCDQAREIIASASVHNDKLILLDCIKRALVDCQSRVGVEYILSAFTYEGDKMRAMSILNTVRSDVADAVPAGGHQGYAALGGLYTQARPLVPQLYGSIAQQVLTIPGQGKIEIPPQAEPGVVPSFYTGHPSYAYPPDKSYQEVRGYPGTQGVEPFTFQTGYPAGGPPLGYHGGAPAPTGFPGLSPTGY